MPSSSALASAPDASPRPGLAHLGPDREVLIAGSGIGGLAAALALARRGIACHVLERREAFAEEGAGIQIGPNGTRILAGLGVADSLEPHTARPEALRVMDGVTGKELIRLPLGRWLAARHGAPYWTAHRADLHAALLSHARIDPLIRISMAADVAEVENTPSGVSVTCIGGKRENGAALIAADGIRSRVRALKFTDAPLRPAHKSAARAVLPAEDMPDLLRRPDTHIWLRPNAHIVHYPVRAGHEYAIVAVFDDPDLWESWSTPVLPGWVLHRAAAFPEPLRSLLSAPKTWRKWSLYTAPPIPRWADGRVALLGDAAHPVLPFLAQGAVLALEDAETLAGCLEADGSTVESALKRYEQKRWSRARDVAAASARNGWRYHLSGFMAAARNKVLTSLPPERLMAGYDWLYGWRAG